jgi:hypothetical protein
MIRRVKAENEGNNELSLADVEENTTDRYDEEINEILEAGEAGVGDLVSLYEQIERRYFEAASSAGYTAPIVTYGTGTRGK